MKRFSPANQVTDRLAALSEALRLRMCHLLEREELSVGEIAKVLQLPQSTVSRHLKVLSAADWLQKRAEGTATLYRLTPDDLDEAARALWHTVREQVERDGHVQEDARRLDGVLSERRTDSLAYFGRVAGEWDQVRGELFGTDFTVRALLSLVPARWTVADLGCGTGNAAEIIAPHVREVIALDQSRPMLDAARKRLSAFENIRFVDGPIEALPLDPGCVDAAMCFMVLHHVPEPAEAISEMRRIIRPGGKALIVDMYQHDRDDYKRTMGHHHLGFSEEVMLGMLREKGFDDVSLVPLPSESRAKGPGLFVAKGAVANEPK